MNYYVFIINCKQALGTCKTQRSCRVIEIMSITGICVINGGVVQWYLIFCINSFKNRSAEMESFLFFDKGCDFVFEGGSFLNLRWRRSYLMEDFVFAFLVLLLELCSEKDIHPCRKIYPLKRSEQNFA